MTTGGAPRFWVAAIGVLVFAQLSIGSMPSHAAGPVKIGYFLTYLPSEIEAHIVSIIANTHPDLGVSDIKLIGTDVAASWLGLRRGDIDVLVEVDLPNQQPLLDKSLAQVELLSQIFASADQGFFVPRYVVDGAGAMAPGLKSVARLGDYKDVFNGKLYDESPGWKSTKYNDLRLKAYAPYFEHIELGDAALVAQVTRAMDRHQPIVFFFYHPHWLFKVCDLVKLPESDPYHSGCFENGEGRCAVPDFSAWLAVRKTLKARNPRLYAMLHHFAIPMTDIEAMMFNVTRDKQPIDRVAAAWVTAHRTTVEGWTRDAVTDAK